MPLMSVTKHGAIATQPATADDEDKRRVVCNRLRRWSLAVTNQTLLPQQHDLTVGFMLTTAFATSQGGKVAFLSQKFEPESPTCRTL